VPTAKAYEDPNVVAAVIKLQRAFRREHALMKEAIERRAKIRDKEEELLASGELQPSTLQLVRFLRYPFSKVNDPSMYSAMTGELFGLVVIITYFMSMYFHPTVFSDNPLLRAWGYNNACVAFDLPPARYVAGCGWCLIFYCTAEFAKRTIQRIVVENRIGKLKKHPRWLDNMFIFAHFGFAVVNATFMLCLFIPPTVSRKWHTRPFLAFMLFKWLSMYANLKEQSLEVDPRVRKLVQPKSFYFLYVYGALVAYLCIASEITYWHHEQYPDAGPFFPWWLSMGVDWSWQLCNFVASAYIPATPIVVDNHVFHPGTLESLQTKFGNKPHVHKTHTKKPWCSCCRRNKMPFPQEICLRPEELALGRDQMATIETLCAMFEKESGKALAKDPTMATDVTCGLTISVLKVKLTIDSRVEGLPPWLRQGLFAGQSTYDGFVRIHITGPGGARFSIRLEVPESMKVLDENENPKTKNGNHQIDLLMAEGLEQFFTPTPDSLRHIMNIAESGVGKLCDGKLSHLIRTLKGLGVAKKGCVNTEGITGKSYYSGTPFAVGRCCAKFGLLPKQSEPLSSSLMPGGVPGASMDGIEPEVATKMSESFLSTIKQAGANAKKGFQWDFCMQVGKRSQTHNLDEGDVAWDPATSPYVPVGTLTVFPEAAFSGGIAGQSGPPLYFNPWNQLDAHRPIGPFNLARYHIYRAHWKNRKAAGGGLQADRICPFLQSMGVA
jgi:hypothetical protein